jgi:hypothetical protein
MGLGDSGPGAHLHDTLPFLIEEFGILISRNVSLGATGGRKKERMVALRPHTPKHIRGGWSHYADTSEPADG